MNEGLYVILLIFAFFIFSTISHYIIKRKCERCGKVKRGICKRNVYIKQPGIGQKLRLKMYICDDCFDKGIDERITDPWDGESAYNQYVADFGDDIDDIHDDYDE